MVHGVILEKAPFEPHKKHIIHKKIIDQIHAKRL